MGHGSIGASQPHARKEGDGCHADAVLDISWVMTYAWSGACNHIANCVSLYAQQRIILLCCLVLSCSVAPLKLYAGFNLD